MLSIVNYYNLKNAYKEEFLKKKIAVKNYGYRGSDKKVPWVIREVVSVSVSDYLDGEPAVILKVKGSHNSYLLTKVNRTWMPVNAELEYKINKEHLEDNLKYYTEALDKLEKRI